MILDSIMIILLSVIFSAFFSGMEIAFVSSNRLMIELEKKQGYFTSPIINIFVKNPSQYIASMLVGNNIALVVYGIQMAVLLDPVIKLLTQNPALIITFQTGISTLIILVTAEYLPKFLFRINPNKVLNFFAIPVVVFYYLFYPIAKVLIFISFSSFKIFGKANKISEPQKIVFGKIDLDDFVAKGKDFQNDNSEQDNEIKYFRNALDFPNIKIRECMIPRTELVGIDINRSVEELISLFDESGFSRILIFKENIDNIIGYIHHSEVFKRPKSIKSNLSSIPFVPETMLASKLLEQLMQQNKSIAVVVDEFGGTSGVITIEDILEEIFGEIEDEYDVVEIIDKQINERCFLFSGKIEIVQINDKYELNIPTSDEYNTIAGFILFNHENIPDKGETIEIDKFKFTVEEAIDSKIETVKLELL